MSKDKDMKQLGSAGNPVQQYQGLGYKSERGVGMKQEEALMLSMGIDPAGNERP